MLFRLAKLQISLETEPHLALFCKNVFSGRQKTLRGPQLFMPMAGPKLNDST